MFAGKAPRIVSALLLVVPLLVVGCTTAATADDGIAEGEGEGDTGPGTDDIDGDGIANDEDPDIDGDGIPNASDADIDGDRIANEVDDDIDGDGIPNAEDDAPYGSNRPGVSGPWADADGDGLPNITDPDDDNDGIPDGVIGIGSCDGTPATSEDNDCDGYCLQIEAGLVPCDDGGLPGTGAPDRDGDGIPDNVDDDDDNDGIPDVDDTNPNGNDPCVGVEFFPPECFPSEEEPEPTCNVVTFNPAAPIPPRIMLVVDRSGSMNEGAAGFGGSKWNATVDSLVGPADGSSGGVVGQLEQGVEFGLQMYPAGGTFELQCVEGDVADNVTIGNHADIRNILRNSIAAGGTPTAAALSVARNALNALGPDGGQRAVILATDGGPNCNDSLDGNTCRCVASSADCAANNNNCLDDTNTVAAAAQLSQAGFPVYVLGLDGALSFADVLTRTAQAGGTGNFFTIGSAQSLASTIEDIAIRVGACRFDVTGAPSADQVAVTVDGITINRDTNRQNGWDLIDVDTVELFGDACATASRATQNVAVQTCF
ncbi:MAG TPA: hypothetical protein VGF99_02215 [Myxococcota bacterium]